MTTEPSSLPIVAFKEWNVIVEELLSGRQILILRKGGIQEEVPFKRFHEQFYLFPTFLHQAEGNLKSALEQRVVKSTVSSNTIRITGYAKVAWSKWLEDLSKLEELDPYHGWSMKCIEERAKWGEQGLYVVAVRVYRLEKEIILQNDPKYGGCRSWVELGEEIQVPQMTPVLSDQEFQKQLHHIKQIVIAK